MGKLLRQAGPIKASQHRLYQIVQELLPNEDVKENFNHPDLIHTNSGKPMELDVFVPALKLALEFQGEQHYHQIYAMVDLPMQQMRDEEKREACMKAGITLIEVPFWWDFKKESLASTIHQIRHDIIMNIPSAAPIPQELPENLRKEKSNNLPLSLADNWNHTEDLNGWLVSEKMDGIRAYWDGYRVS